MSFDFFPFFLVFLLLNLSINEFLLYIHGAFVQTCSRYVSLRFFYIQKEKKQL